MHSTAEPMLIGTLVVLGIVFGCSRHVPEITALVDQIAHEVTTWTWFQDWIWKE